MSSARSSARKCRTSAVLTPKVVGDEGRGVEEESGWASAPGRDRGPADLELEDRAAPGGGLTVYDPASYELALGLVAAS
jgi:hypothetical protein